MTWPMPSLAEGHDAVPLTTQTSGCSNCGAANVATYCAECGEKQPDHHDLTVGHFLHEVFHELVHLDSKLFRTLRDLFARPGLLTVEYFSGRKKRAIAPLRLFLTLFALQFVVYSIYKPAALYSVETFMRFDQSGNMTRLVEKQAGRRGLVVAEYIDRLDAKWHRNLSLLQLANILGVAMVLKLLYLRRRRFLAEHLVFTAHFLSFSYCLSLIVWPIYVMGGLKPGPLQHTMSALSVAVLLSYLYLAQRRYYGPTPGKAAVKTVLTYAGSYVVAVSILAGALLAAIVALR